MWDASCLKRLDVRPIMMIIALMSISCITIGSIVQSSAPTFLSPMVLTQLKGFFLGWIAYIFFAGLDYHKLKDWSWAIYAVFIVLLVGLFFTSSIQNVKRWYRLPMGIAFQPSEFAKLAVVFALSRFIEYQQGSLRSMRCALQAMSIVALPFLLIVKEPDLGTALVLIPISLVIFYFGGLNRRFLSISIFFVVLGMTFIGLIFLGIFSYEETKELATIFLKDYQYERLNPNTYHQVSSQTAIALGGVFGVGMGNSAYTAAGWLPAAATDSIFPAFAEQSGLFGTILILLLFFGLIYFSFQVTALAKDDFGRLLSAGISVYLAIHVLINIGMMCGVLPITGVPLVLMSYGGSSVVATMSALGILQSIYSRRFLF